jgi:outer membrane scaffolding protein for murein synthesis (MipA/OmpV family)
MLKFCILFLFLISGSVHAKLPLYELGLAGGLAHISDYPGSNQGRTRQIVIPTFRYRGEVFRADKKGTRARFFKTEKTDVDLSFGASFPANSKDNDAREGMSDLHWIGEIGPRLNIELYKDSKNTIELELPIRFAFSTDFNFTQHRGYRFYPQIDFRRKVSEDFKFSFSIKMNWATEGLTDYFYEVSKEDITPDRERFNSKEGYIGSDLSHFISYSSDDIFYILGIKYSNYEGSSNSNSPLFKSKEDTSVFFAINYFFYKSKSLEKN